MIPLDWKKKKKKDTIDFYENKLPKGDYDIEIVYNIYPERINNKIPKAVITFVSKTLAKKIVKDSEKYFDFYDYLLKEKGENGYTIFAYIMQKAVKKEPKKFLQYIKKILFELDNQKEANLIMDKAIYPLFKKKPQKYLPQIMEWLKKGNKYLINSIKKLLVKTIRYHDKEIAKKIFNKLESTWLYASEDMVKLNIAVLKAIFKIDKKFYLSIYSNYHKTHNPIFAEILEGGIKCYHKDIEAMANSWTKSGNVKLKKIGKHAQRKLKKLKK